MEEYMLPCMNKKLFGIECFGCGTQRSLMLLVKGDFVGAFNMFPAIFTTLLFFIVLALHFIDKSRNYQKVIIGLAITNAVIMLVSYFYRLTNY
ncbi:DUF2752 domain-containing protein [Flavobacterium macrobrachii]|jgi:Protein of unknown function (DUF2752)|uniref:DUF2752 domain-containing protein n=1 Tax=Flavobacterium macrobrachii TaxID=591204 RepID=A0ABS2CT54_9FLAO|nr:DUF2752 domain-containing protein [Flavobacterium macrobrachii]MBM6498154.1 DUF2752 domain-containing protein [Flavobacterium macrobrachii]